MVEKASQKCYNSLLWFAISSCRSSEMQCNAFIRLATECKTGSSVVSIFTFSFKF